MPGPESFLHQPRDRLTRIGGLFLSEDHEPRRFALHAHPEDARALPAIDLARALACLGHPVTLLEHAQDALLQLRVLPCADTIPVISTRPELHAASRRRSYQERARDNDDIFIVESTSAVYTDKIPLLVLAVPAETRGMRRAWVMLKTLVAGGTPEVIGVTITGASDIGDAEDCYARFATAAERFIGIEIVSYACLLRSGQNREQELRNIAALLIADMSEASGAANHEHIDEESR